MGDDDDRRAESWISRIRSRHFSWNARSPTARISSTSSTSGWVWIATANAEAQEHAGGVELHGRVDEVLDLGEGDDVVELGRTSPVGHAEQPAVHEDVLPAGELGVKAHADADERGDRADDAQAAGVGAETPLRMRSSVVLPDPLRPMTPMVSPRRDLEIDVAQRPERLVSGRDQVAGLGQPSAAARRRSGLAVALADAAQGDGEIVRPTAAHQSQPVHRNPLVAPERAHRKGLAQRPDHRPERGSPRSARRRRPSSARAGPRRSPDWRGTIARSAPCTQRERVDDGSRVEGDHGDGGDEVAGVAEVDVQQGGDGGERDDEEQASPSRPAAAGGPAGKPPRRAASPAVPPRSRWRAPAGSRRREPPAAAGGGSRRGRRSRRRRRSRWHQRSTRWRRKPRRSSRGRRTPGRTGRRSAPSRRARRRPRVRRPAVAAGRRSRAGRGKRCGNGRRSPAGPAAAAATRNGAGHAAGCGTGWTRR